MIKSFGIPQSEGQQEDVLGKVTLAKYWFESKDASRKQDYDCKSDGYVLEIPQNPKSKVRFAINIAKIPKSLEWNEFINHVIEFGHQAFESYDNYIVFYRSVTSDNSYRAQIHWPRVYVRLDDREALLKSLSTWVGFDVVKYQFLSLSVPGSMIDSNRKRYLCFGVYKDGNLITGPNEINVKLNDILITCHEINSDDYSSFRIPEPKSVTFVEDESMDVVPTITPVPQPHQKASEFSDSDEDQDPVFSLKNTIKRARAQENQITQKQQNDNWEEDFQDLPKPKKLKQKDEFIFEDLPPFVLEAIKKLTPEKGNPLQVKKGDYRTNVWFIKTQKKKLGDQCVMGALHRKGDWNTFAVSILPNGNVRVKCKNPDPCAEKKWMTIGKIQKKKNGALHVVNVAFGLGTSESDNESENVSITSHISSDNSLSSSTISLAESTTTNIFTIQTNNPEDPFGYVALEIYCPDKLRTLAMQDTTLALHYINRYYCFATSLIYARRSNKLTWETMTEHNMMSSIRNIRTKKKHRSLFELWMNWALRRECYEITWKPSLAPDNEHPRVLNLYPGLAVKPSKLSYDEMMKAVEPLLFHIRFIWSQGDEKLERFFLHYFAHIFQKPDIKTGIALVLTSSQGKGKSIIFEEIFLAIFNDLLGFFSKFKELFGDFNSQIAKKLLLVVEEIEFNESAQHASLIKHLVTAKKIYINPKGRDGYSALSYSNCVFMSNSNIAVKVELSDRRYVIAALSELLIDPSHFKKLLQGEMNMAAVVQFFLQFDTSNVRLQDIKPTTPSYKYHKIASMTPLQKWCHQILLNPSEHPQNDFWEKQITRHTIKSAYDNANPKNTNVFGFYSFLNELGVKNIRTRNQNERQRQMIFPSFNEMRQKFAKKCGYDDPSKIFASEEEEIEDEERIILPSFDPRFLTSVPAFQTQVRKS